MINELQIERFKSIKSAKVELGAVNLFIGGNGSGKSNLLEAVGVVASALSRGLTDSDFRRKGVRITPAALIKSAFKYDKLPRTSTLRIKASHDIDYYCSLSSSETDTNISFAHENCLYGDEKIFARSPKGASALGTGLKRKIDKYRGIWDQTKAIVDYHDEAVSELEAIASYSIYSPQTEFLRGRKVGSTETPPIGLHGEGLPTAVRTLLRDYDRVRKKKGGENSVEHEMMDRALDLPFKPSWASAFRVGKISEQNLSSDVEIPSDDMVYFVDKFMHSKRNRLSVYDSSEGTLFLLFASILIAHKESPQIFALDNVDSALNPSLTRTLLEEIIAATTARREHHLGRGPQQVFLTSHNPTSLDAFDIFDNDNRIFVVRRSKDGETEVERLMPPEGMKPSDWHELSNGRRLSEMWIDGEISGALGSPV